MRSCPVLHFAPEIFQFFSKQLEILNGLIYRLFGRVGGMEDSRTNNRFSKFLVVLDLEVEVAVLCETFGY